MSEGAEASFKATSRICRRRTICAGLPAALPSPKACMPKLAQTFVAKAFDHVVKYFFTAVWPTPERRLAL
jgi:hypothetical protein